MKEKENLRYPIGKFTYGKSYTLDETRKNIKTISKTPKQLKKLLKKIGNDRLDMPYRKGGWTVKIGRAHV